MSTALGARPYVQLLLRQSACTSMCHHMYDWNHVNCDVKQPIHLTVMYAKLVLYESKIKYCLCMLPYVHILLRKPNRSTEGCSKLKRSVDMTEWSQR